METVKKGDKVKIDYTGKKKDGVVFTSSQESGLVEFVAGGGEVIPGLSQAVIGMEPGQKKTVEFGAEMAFGPHNPDLEKRVPKQKLPDEAKVGDQLMVKGEKRNYPIWVKEIDSQSAVVDANHPLAGQDLIFDIEVLSVESA
jgi:peptidylprolyl isomerase